MTNLEITQSRLASNAAAHGQWTLKPQRALTLRPREDGELRIAHGAAWVTTVGPHAGTKGGPDGDRLLEPGACLRLRRGQTLVLEPIATRSVPLRALAFDWLATPPADAPHWNRDVAEPARELRQALLVALRALVRLTYGLLTWPGRRLSGTGAPRPAHST